MGLFQRPASGHDMAEREWAGEAREHFERGYEEQLAGRIDAAIESYRRSIAIHPSAEAHTFLGWALSHQGRHEDAIAECHRAIEIDPDFGNPYNDIGAYLIEQGNLNEAIPWLEKAIHAPRYESYCFPHYNLGRVYERKHQWKKAMECYRDSLSHNPQYTLAEAALRRLQARMN